MSFLLRCEPNSQAPATGQVGGTQSLHRFLPRQDCLTMHTAEWFSGKYGEGEPFPSQEGLLVLLREIK